MILDELYGYYLRLLNDEPNAVPQEGWSVEKVSWALPIGMDGSMGEPISLGDEGKKAKYLSMMVPQHDVRSGTKPKPFFLCDTAAYLLGLEDKRGAEKRKASCEKHLELLEGCQSPEANALRLFFQNTDIAQGLSQANRDALMSGGWCVLYFVGKCFAHDISELGEAWNNSLHKDVSHEQLGQCGVTGKVAPLARLFPQITGIPGAQGSGASLVSFNQQSFESYGKTQSYNASISDSVAFGTGSALKYLFQDVRHRVRVGDMTVVFWADRNAACEDELILQMLGGKAITKEDATTVNLVRASLESIREGKAPVALDVSVQYCVLGISPNAARLVVRFFEVATLGKLAKNYGQYLQDLEIECDEKYVNNRTTSLLVLLKQTALLGKDENLPAPLVNPCFRALLKGTPFPSSLETALLSRMRADHAGNKPWDMMARASLMKACLVRKQRNLQLREADKESEVTVALNRMNGNAGYLLGRMFAVLERAQQGALGEGVNATVRDKYMSSAATTPSRVYATLLGLGQKHIGALRHSENKGWLANRLERELDEIFDLLEGEGQPIPTTLSTDDQLLFYIGYYQERVDLWKKRSEVQDKVINEEA